MMPTGGTGCDDAEEERGAWCFGRLSHRKVYKLIGRWKAIAPLECGDLPVCVRHAQAGHRFSGRNCLSCLQTGDRQVRG